MTHNPEVLRDYMAYRAQRDASYGDENGKQFMDDLQNSGAFMPDEMVALRKVYDSAYAAQRRHLAFGTGPEVVRAHARMGTRGVRRHLRRRRAV